MHFNCFFQARRLTLVGAILTLFTHRIITAEGTNQLTPDQLLLKDYHPHSIYRVLQTSVSKARFPVVDMHSHPYAKNPEQVAQWVRTMDEAGVQTTVILTGEIGTKFDDLVRLYGKYPGRFSLWCGFDLSGISEPNFGPAAVAELERCVKAGARGVGELSDKGCGLRAVTNQPVHMDDPRLDPLLEKCADFGLPVNIHIGEPIWMYEPMDSSNDGLMNSFKWRLDNQTNILSHAAVVATLDRSLSRHSRTTFIACHFVNCCYDLSILADLFQRHQNLYADNAARYAETAPIPRYMARFYSKWQDRLLYGTDMGLSPGMYHTTFRILETEDEHFYDWNLFSYHWPLHGFGLSDAILERVYSKNARKLVKL